MERGVIHSGKCFIFFGDTVDEDLEQQKIVGMG